jgi:actin, other eukaryote
LKIEPKECPILLTESPFNSKENREKMIQIMFETFSVPAYYVCFQEVLSLYSSGRTTGLVLDSGYSVSQSVTVYEGYAQPRGVFKMDFGGKQLTDFMMKLLTERGINSVGQEMCNEMKEKLCYIPLHDKEEIEKTFTLPDGKSITLGSERFKCPEALFKPDLIGMDFPGFHQCAFKSIEKYFDDFGKELYSDIVISGGSSMFEGFSQRIISEMMKFAPSTMKIKVVAPPERKFSSWIGGSILASQISFNPMMISDIEYAVEGPSVVHRRC